MLPVITTGKTTGRRSSGFLIRDVITGLKAANKYLQLQIFLIDEAGDKLFQQIMACPEYYPTRCEMEVLQHQSDKIARVWLRGNKMGQS